MCPLLSLFTCMNDPLGAPKYRMTIQSILIRTGDSTFPQLKHIALATCWWDVKPPRNNSCSQAGKAHCSRQSLR